MWIWFFIKYLCNELSDKYLIGRLEIEDGKVELKRVANLGSLNSTTSPAMVCFVKDSIPFDILISVTELSLFTLDLCSCLMR